MAGRGSDVGEGGLLAVAPSVARLLRVGRCVAWLGSGLSRAAGYPEWEEAVLELCKACGVEPLADSDPDAEALIDKAEECKDSDHKAYEGCLVNMYGKRRVVVRRAFSQVVGLPFRAYVTTNFDPQLRNAALDSRHIGHTNVVAYPEHMDLSDIGPDRRPVYYIHGLAQNMGNGRDLALVLTRSEYEDAYGGGPVSSLLMNLLPGHSVLFLGYGLGEKVFWDVIRRLDKLRSIQRKGATLEKLAILPRTVMPEGTPGTDEKRRYDEKTRREEEQDDLLVRSGISPVRYTPRDRELHSEIEDMLERVRVLMDESEDAGEALLNE